MKKPIYLKSMLFGRTDFNIMILSKRECIVVHHETSIERNDVGMSEYYLKNSLYIESTEDEFNDAFTHTSYYLMSEINRIQENLKLAI